MPFLFACPQCDATIRVPDGSSGLRGRCPCCGRRVYIPKPGPWPPPMRRKGAGNPAALLFAGTKAAVADPVGTTPTPPETRPAPPRVASGDIALGANPVANDREVLPPASPAGEPGWDAIAGPQPKGPRVVSAPTRPKKASSNGLILGGIAVLLLGVGVGGTLWMQTWAFRLKGEVTAAIAPDFRPPRQRVTSTLSAEELAPIVSGLERSPLTLGGAYFDTRIGVHNDDITVDATIKPPHKWVQVQLESLPVLAEFRASEREPLATYRDEVYNNAAPQFFKACQALFGSKRTNLPLAKYRETIALNRLNGPLGFVVAAAVGNNIYPCSYEDREGNLYFALPAATKSFELVGRPLTGGALRFPARLPVRVKGEAKLAPAAEEPSPEAAADPNLDMQPEAAAQ